MDSSFRSNSNAYSNPSLFDRKHSDSKSSATSDSDHLDEVNVHISPAKNSVKLSSAKAISPPRPSENKSSQARQMTVSLTPAGDIEGAISPGVTKKNRIQEALFCLIKKNKIEQAKAISDLVQNISDAYDLVNEAEYLTPNQHRGDLLESLEQLKDKNLNLKTMIQDAALSSPEAAKALTELQELADQTISEIENNIQFIKENDPPSVLTRGNLFRGKAIISEAAIAVIDEQIKIKEDKLGALLKTKNVPITPRKSRPQPLFLQKINAVNSFSGRIENQIKKLTAEIESLKSAKNNFLKRIDCLTKNHGESQVLQSQIVLNPRSILGAEKKIGLFSKFKNYFKANKTIEALAAYKSSLLSGRVFACATPEISESTIVAKALESVLRSAGVASAKKVAKHGLHSQEVNVINSRQAQLVEKNIVLNFDGTTAKCISKMSHAASFDSNEFRKNYAGKIVCSHSVHESQKAAALAKTEFVVNEKVVFSGLRHGTLCAFGWTRNGVAGMPNKELGESAKVLVSQMPKADPQDYQMARLLLAEKSLTAEQFGHDVRRDTNFMRMIREQANLNRARDILMAAIVTNPEKMKLLPELRVMDRSDSNQNESKAAASSSPAPINIEVSINSISLLTPDGFRNGASDNERMMAREQTEALKFLAKNRPQTVEINGHKVNVTARISAFSFGVNAGGVGSGSHFDDVSGWEQTKPQNDAAFRNLLGDAFVQIPVSAKKNTSPVYGGQVQAFIEKQDLALKKLQLEIESTESKSVAFTEDEIAAKKKSIVDIEIKLAAVKKLSLQCTTLYTTKGFLDTGNEPYKLVSRLALLTFLVSEPPWFNCKSGKDRTGMLDVQAKFLATQLEMTGKIPDYDRERDPAEKAQLRAIVLNGGNHEMQQAFTGYPGYKLFLNLFKKQKTADALHREFGGGPGLSKREKIAVKNKAVEALLLTSPNATVAEKTSAAQAALKLASDKARDKSALFIGASGFTAS